jgi:DNA (cytosine-5)-methyltransferase 1
MSTCSGISAASVAWKPLGYVFAAFAEVDPFACHVLAQRCDATAPRHLPEGSKPKDYSGIVGGGVPNLGDLTQITDADLEALGDVDVLEGGTPCQGFSIAGLRGGLIDPRGQLTLAFVQLAHRMCRINNLKYIVWENVHGVLNPNLDNVFGHFLAGLGAMGGRAERPLEPPRDGWTNAGHLFGPAGSFAWRTLDAQHWGVPQRRKRVFLVGAFGTRGLDPLEVLGEYGAREGGSGPRGEEEGADGSLGHSSGPGGSAARGGRAVAYVGGQGERAGTIGASETVAPCLKAANSGSTRTPFVAQLYDRQAADKYGDNGVASTLRSNTSAGYDHDLVVHPRVIGTLCKSAAGLTRAAGQANEGDFCIVHKSPVPGNGRKWLVRRLMPVEAERLMGFPDGWTDVTFRGRPAADTNRYGALGNSMATVCMSYIGEKLLAAHHDVDQHEEYVYGLAV